MCFPMMSTDWNQEMGYAANHGPLGIYYLATEAETPFCGIGICEKMFFPFFMKKTDLTINLMSNEIYIYIFG